MLNFIFRAILFLLNVASWVVLIYVLMALIVPQNKYTQFIGRYVEPILAPLRKFLYRVFPKLQGMGIDFSPLLFYFLIMVARWLVALLWNILL